MGCLINDTYMYLKIMLNNYEGCMKKNEQGDKRERRGGGREIGGEEGGGGKLYKNEMENGILTA